MRYLERMSSYMITHPLFLKHEGLRSIKVFSLYLIKKMIVTQVYPVITTKFHIIINIYY